MARQRRLVMGPCIVEIDRIVIREVQYQLEVNRCRNEEVIVKGNFGWVWPMWAGRPRVGIGAMHKVQYQLEVNWCRNEEIIWGTPGLVMGPCIVEIYRIVIREVHPTPITFDPGFQGSSANSVGGDSGQDGQTAEITTISPRFSKSSVGITKIKYLF
ncbi:hypothetical protein DPMN_143516 [Dreissena polymorpha]|uniref:Uncharacterized protein n=1 Tax=Dreissena polymorpha TaxID=45954 RepID=A0A9D4GJA6_DREPO|nr:hypothetical protein DPMN_143516 [Dreissena polymorpha]